MCLLDDRDVREDDEGGGGRGEIDGSIDRNSYAAKQTAEHR